MKRKRFMSGEAIDDWGLVTGNWELGIEAAVLGILFAMWRARVSLAREGPKNLARRKRVIERSTWDANRFESRPLLRQGYGGLAGGAPEQASPKLMFIPWTRGGEQSTQFTIFIARAKSCCNLAADFLL
jgi:hypothetical protein